MVIMIILKKDMPKPWYTFLLESTLKIFFLILRNDRAIWVSDDEKNSEKNEKNSFWP